MSLLLIFVLGSLSCANAGPPPKKDVIKAALATPDALILDVRTQSEFSDGHVEGAVNLPVDELDDFANITQDKERQIIVHCAAGVRSAQATKQLKEMGYKNILDAKTPSAVAKAMGKPLVK